MHLTFLGKGGSGVKDCPTLFATEKGTYLVQGWKTGRSDTVEIPHLLTGFAEQDTFIGATMTDTGRGWWMFDDERMAFNLTGEDGKPGGLAVTADPGIAAYCQTVRKHLWELAVPYAEYVDSHYTRQ